MLGSALMRVFKKQAVGWDREDIDATRAEKLKSKIGRLKPSIIINCAAYNDVDGAENNRELAYALNAELPQNLSAITNSCGIILVHFSTNYVFDGKKGEYSETDWPNPQSIYAKSKYQGEIAVVKNAHKYYIIRTSVLFGPKGQSKHSKQSFVQIILKLLKKQNKIKAVSDEINSLTYVFDLAAQVKILLEQAKPFGVYHIINSGEASWFDIAKEIFHILKKHIQLIPVPSSEFPRSAIRPKKAVLINTKLKPLRPWQSALADFLLKSGS